MFFYFEEGEKERDGVVGDEKRERWWSGRRDKRVYEYEAVFRGVVRCERSWPWL